MSHSFRNYSFAVLKTGASDPLFPIIWTDSSLEITPLSLFSTGELLREKGDRSALS
jgi:hypothetical protein